MPLDPELHRLIEDKLAHTRARQWEMPIADVRKGFRDFWTPAITGVPPAVERIENLTIPGPAGDIRARIYASRRDRRDPLLVFFHGGGYVKGGIDESDAFCRRLAIATRHAVLSVDYRLAPENPFPAAADDALAAAAWASSHANELGALSGPLVVSGESAGGNLAAVTCLRARADPRIAIRSQVLLQPVLDFTLSRPSMALSETECLVPRDDLEWYYRTYYGGSDLKNPDVSPLFAPDASGLPAALIVTAEYDTLRDEGAAYAERLQKAGVEVRYTCYPGMVHGFQQMAGLVAAAQAVVQEISSFVKHGAVSGV
ncbi:MAG TPA: alpha/beta hydrolase [Casimicrobiaceae bacterium]|nr:alpha/beta hydrolase [Casimicrobiaceae bacterium]